MDPPDVDQQRAIDDLPWTVRPLPARVVARRRHAQPLAHDTRRPVSLGGPRSGGTSSAVPRRWPQPFLKCHAPSAVNRSRDEAGKSPPPGRERNAGPTPVSCAAPTRIPPSASIAPVAQHRGGDAQLACDPAQPPTAAHQQGYRFPLELIRKMTRSLAHSTPFRSRRSLAKVSTNSREPQRSSPSGPRTPCSMTRCSCMHDG